MVDHGTQALDDITASKQTPARTENRAFQRTKGRSSGVARQNTYGSMHSSTRRTLNHAFAFLFLLLGIRVSD